MYWALLIEKVCVVIFWTKILANCSPFFSRAVVDIVDQYHLPYEIPSPTSLIILTG